MSNTIASDNFIGIDVAPGVGAVVKGVLGKVTTNHNNNGIVADGSSPGASPNITVNDSVSFSNGVGILSLALPGGAPTTVYLAHVTVTGNSTGVFNNGGTILTYGNNDINGNATDVSGTLTPVATR